LLVSSGELRRFIEAAKGDDEPLAVKSVTVLGAVADAQVVEALEPLVIDPQKQVTRRIAAAQAVGRNRRGQQFLFELARSGQLPPELNFTAANILLTSADESLRTEAAKYLQLPASADREPIPPLAELVARRGDAHRGKQIFQTTGTCFKCHIVRGEGKNVGPDLSEVGSKLARDAFFVSILDPSAGISHNYESYVLVTTSGNVLTGLMVNRTDQAVTIRTAEGIDQEIPTREIDELQKSKTSLMPADLQKLLSVQDLVDVVEYLTTLTKQG
jgi:putative heme-binding domain-containing protein